MIAIKIDFPAGRWHATAWGSHVNEGVTEWPPCPWRLCRALIAAWHWKHRDNETVLRSLIEKLAEQPPTFRLPRASTAHTRHYMPVVAGPKETKTKVFDAFVHVSAGESVWIRWDVDLSTDETALLSILLENLSYLGRAESLVCASLADWSFAKGTWARPALQESAPDQEIIRLLAPQFPNVYADWAATQSTSTKTSKSKKIRKADAVPTTLFDALQLDNADWKKEGWNLPPGARWVDYTRPRDSLKVAPTGTPPMRAAKSPPTVARFALVSKVQPSITQSLSLAERFHQALCKRLDGYGNSPALTGLDEQGRPLSGNQHVYFLPECDEHAYISHMTLHAPCGFDQAACRALAGLGKVWGAEGFDVNIVLLATGQPREFATACAYFQPAHVWRSLTPFVPVRHAKATRTGIAKLDPANGLQIGSPEHDCLRLLSLMAPEAKIVQVKKLGARLSVGLREISALDFQRQRRHGGGIRGDHRGYALQLEFENPTILPFGLGYAAHFGLGLFAPIA